MPQANKPRYRQLADDLRKTIVSGRLQPGDQLMTELELCTHYKVSRHTAREALRLLTEDKLIERRQGSGSVVANISAPAFAQPIGDFDTILQYARDARFTLSRSGKADQAALERTGLSGEYRQFIGLRQIGDAPALAITAIYVRSTLAPSPADIVHMQGPVSEWIEQTHNIAVERVTQRMEAVALNKSQADRLGLQKGYPALRTLRRYRDAGDDVILLSESLHPAGRFAYEIRLDRSR